MGPRWTRSALLYARRDVAAFYAGGHLYVPVKSHEFLSALAYCCLNTNICFATTCLFCLRSLLYVFVFVLLCTCLLVADNRHMYVCVAFSVRGLQTVIDHIRTVGFSIRSIDRIRHLIRPSESMYRDH